MTNLLLTYISLKDSGLYYSDQNPSGQEGTNPNPLSAGGETPKQK